MPKGKPWTKEQEKQLQDLLASGISVIDIAKKMGKSSHAIRMKIGRLELKEVGPDEKKCGPTTSKLDIPDDLPSIEMQLRVLAGTIKALQKGGLEKVDVMSCGRLISGVKTYKELFVDYVGYCEIEQKVDYAIEWMRKRDEERKNLDRVKSKTE